MARHYKRLLPLWEEQEPPVQEVQWINDLKRLIEDRLEDWYPKDQTMRRDTHTKGHAAVRGEFIVPDLPQELRVGLFKKPATYPVLVRFSNLDVRVQSDIKKDVRAMAIKLMGVPGKRLWPPEGCSNLDLVLMGNPTFFTANLRQFYLFEKSLFEGGWKIPYFMLTHPRTLWAVFRYTEVCNGLANLPFYSQTPYRFGERAVKYHAVPRQRIYRPVPARPSPDYLREWLREDLEERELEWDFCVQFQTDAHRMPIEDSMVEWPTKLSPPHPVARLRIHRQEFCDDGEDLSFNPWRTLPEHRPMASINRARLAIYPAVARRRRARNQMPEDEPTAASDGRAKCPMGFG